VVTSIDPAETIVDGVSVYEASVYFNEQDPKIKSGMTASVNIFSGSKENVLRIGKQFIEKDEMGEFVYGLYGRRSKSKLISLLDLSEQTDT
jgi:hypothetical protein